MSLRAMNYAICPTHGETLFHVGRCVCCEPAPRPQPYLTDHATSGRDLKRGRVLRPAKAEWSGKPGRPKVTQLSPAELRVAHAYEQGMTRAQIALTCGINIGSVSNCLTRAMNKLLMNSRQELVQWVRARRAA